uniref:hypothetical protein n=1 Tax=Ruminococcus bicirculans (ex Wegman et al. 2014) TaxID=1160721 RepID=UPI003FD6E4CA
MITDKDIQDRIINNDALFNNIFVVQQKFDIVPEDTEHIGTSIAYQDLTELRDEFICELYDTIVDWVYSSGKYTEIKNAAISKGKTEQAVN